MSLLPARFLFRFAVGCRVCRPLWTGKGAGLGAAHRLPSLGLLEDQAGFAELAAGWSEEGLAFRLEVRGKEQPVWCRASRVEDSDGLQLWIDTRDVHTVHRAGRFCHRFLFLPAGSGPRQDEPFGVMLPINRARELPRAVEPKQLVVRSEIRRDGYRLEALLPAAVLTGFDPQEHPRLGFNFAVSDREVGLQTFSAGGTLPFAEDPSLWGTLELVGP